MDLENNHVPPEILIHIFNFLDVKNVCRSIVLACRTFCNICEKYHYWKLACEKLQSKYYSLNEYDLQSLRVELSKWKSVYRFLLSKRLIFEESSIKKVFFGAKVTNGRKSFRNDLHTDKGYPTCLLNKKVEQNEILKVSLRVEFSNTSSKQYGTGFFFVCSDYIYQMYDRRPKKISTIPDYTFGYFGTKTVIAPPNQVEGFMGLNLEHSRLEVDGEIIHVPASLAIERTRSVKDNDIITMVLNRKKHVLSFHLNRDLVAATRIQGRFRSGTMRVGFALPSFIYQVFTIVKNPENLEEVDELRIWKRWKN